MKGALRKGWFVWTAFFAFRRWSLQPDWLAQGGLCSRRDRCKRALRLRASLSSSGDSYLAWLPSCEQDSWLSEKEGWRLQEGWQGNGKAFFGDHGDQAAWCRQGASDGWGRSGRDQEAHWEVSDFPVKKTGMGLRVCYSTV